MSTPRRPGRVAAPVVAALAAACLTGAGLVTVAAPAGAVGADPVAPVAPGVAAAAGAARPARPRDAALAAAVRRAVAGAGFTDIVDFGAEEGACPGNPGCPRTAPRAAHVPTVDTAVIELDAAGRPIGATEVLLSRDQPQPVAVTVDADLRASDVHWYRWDTARAAGRTSWDARRVAADDLVPAPAIGRQSFMSPYPASVFHLMVAAGTLHLVDQGLIALDVPYRYLQAPGSTCLGAVFSDTLSTRTLLDRMVTTSDNESTCMLLKQLGDLGQLDAMNAWLSGLGLTTLQVSGIDPGSGGRWDPGRITMTALDTARLLLLVNGSPGVLWHMPAVAPSGGVPVTSAAALSPGSRALLRGLLGEQGFNEVLSTANWCGRGYPASGIPQRVSQRWIDPVTGAVTVDGVPYGQDVRPCNASAQVTYAHKTGLTYNFGGDAGIVDSLPANRDRHYIVVVLSDLGYRYADLHAAASAALPCAVGVCYTEAFAELGKAVDDAVGAPAADLTGSSSAPLPPTPAPTQAAQRARRRMR